MNSHTKLSVNINKVALLRNSRLGNFPDLYEYAQKCEEYGAEGITVHPRPDERHIRYSDIPELKKVVTTELNIEGNPTEKFMQLVLENVPDQCTLVPDAENVLTSDSGWDTVSNKAFLTEITKELQNAGIRVSIFVDPIEEMIRGAQSIGAERIELYTGKFAHDFLSDPELAVASHTFCSQLAHELGLEVNAGHDLNLDNLDYYRQQVPYLQEVSIGHALTADALYFGLEKTIEYYKEALKKEN